MKERAEGRKEGEKREEGRKERRKRGGRESGRQEKARKGGEIKKQKREWIFQLLHPPTFTLHTAILWSKEHVLFIAEWLGDSILHPR